MQKIILVLGATGLLGKPAAERLKADGFQVRIMLRDLKSEKAQILNGYETVQGDVTDLESLENAMRGCQGVHISIGGAVDQLSAENVAKLAPELGIEQITYISGATVCPQNGWFEMVAQKLKAEEALQNCGVPTTIFCPTWPMEQIARFSREGNPFMLGKQPLPVHFFAEKDLAKMISAAYQKEEAKNKRFTIYGPQAMSMKEAIRKYCTFFHPEVEKISSMPIWLAKIIAALTKNADMKFAANLMGYFNKTSETGSPAEANRILGAPLVTLQEWIQERK